MHDVGEVPAEAGAKPEISLCVAGANPYHPTTTCFLSWIVLFVR